MGVKRFKANAFGVQTQRFTSGGVHPGIVVPNTSFNAGPSKVGPGSYDTDKLFTHYSERKKTIGADWKRAHFIERTAAIPHFLYREEYDTKKEQIRKLGPGYYNVDDFHNNDTVQHSGQGLSTLRSKTRRFPREKIDVYPGPGTYGNDGIPDKLKVTNEKERRFNNALGLLSRGGKGGRQFYKMNNNNGPGTYPLKDPLSQFLNKSCGNRGMYDVFSEDRDKIIHGHYARKSVHDLSPGEYKLTNSLEDMDHRTVRFKGHFYKEVQYPVKPHQRVYWDDPANVPVDPKHQVCSATYSPKSLAFPKESPSSGKIPFLTSQKRNDHRQIAMFTGNNNSVGPGRYDMGRMENLRSVNPYYSSFNTKSQRLNQEQQKLLRERLKAHNQREDQDTKLNHHATEQSPRMDISYSFKSKPVIIE